MAGASDVADGAAPDSAAFNPTHLIHLSELPASERENYFDLLIAADAHFHRDYESGDVLADMRILGPGVKMPSASPKQKDEGPRLTPQEKLAVQAAEAAAVVLPGAIECASGDVFNYLRYEGIIKLIMGKGGNTTQYKPKRRTLAWVMRLVHEIYDARYARDTSDIGDTNDDFDDSDPAVVAARRAKDELLRQTSVFPIFIVDMFSKKYGLKALVESTTWDLLYSCDCLRSVSPDVEVFCRFVSMTYDADELLYYSYVRSLTQSVLNANFKAHWADTGRQREVGNGGGFDRAPVPLTLQRRECNYIATTIFIRNAGEEVDHEKQMFADFMGTVDQVMQGGNVIDSSDFMKIAVERYFATRPAGEHDASGMGDLGDGGAEVYDMAPPLAPSASEEAAAAAVALQSEEPFTFDNPLFNAVSSGQMVEEAEGMYIDNLMSSQDFEGLPDEVLNEVRDDLALELSNRLLAAENAGATASSENEFMQGIAHAIQGFDAMAKLVAEHVQSLKVSNSFK
jgi:hypothetical protein